MMSDVLRIAAGLSSYFWCWYWKPTARLIGPAGRFMISFDATPSTTHAVGLGNARFAEELGRIQRCHARRCLVAERVDHAGEHRRQQLRLEYVAGEVGLGVFRLDVVRADVVVPAPGQAGGADQDPVLIGLDLVGPRAGFERAPVDVQVFAVQVHARHRRDDAARRGSTGRSPGRSAAGGCRPAAAWSWLPRPASAKSGTSTSAGHTTLRRTAGCSD